MLTTGTREVTVTLEPIGSFGFSPAFWNLPVVTPEGESIEYFTFSSRWDMRLLTHLLSRRVPLALAMGV
ncbi:MAG TPA: hypothetical protein VGS80_16840, partial [Ktedonobacterales bacterium]|nr:hypothetical protein [Ktedonobacterales bacterium]